MTYEEFETYIYSYIATNWDTALATPISEYKPREQEANVNNSMDISIGIEGGEETLGSFDGGTKNMNIQSGTVNLMLKLNMMNGMARNLVIIEAARSLFNQKILNGYIKFRVAVKKDMGTIDGKLVKLIVCPFTVEIIE